MTRIAIICARAGSKGVPGKNLRLLGGKPLIGWTVAQALASGDFDLVAVSSDSAEIRAAAAAEGPVFLVERPDEMATDTASVHPAIIHALSAAEAQLGKRCEAIAFLQATSPLRSLDDVRSAVHLWDRQRPGSVVSVTAARASPYYTLLEQDAQGRVRLSKEADPPFARRQDAPACWELNGAIYIFDRDRYAAEQKVLYPDTVLLEMPPERSLDIDTEYDWQVACALWAASDHT